MFNRIKLPLLLAAIAAACFVGYTQRKPDIMRRGIPAVAHAAKRSTHNARPFQPYYNIKVTP